MNVEFRLLGAVEAHADGRVVGLGPARQRCVLAVLLIEVNRVVLSSELVDRVWGEHPPRSARNTLHSYVSRLRRVLAEDAEIEHQSGGYRLTVKDDAVDVHRFWGLVADARAADDEHALARYEQALGLWRGEPFAGLDTPWLAAVRAKLEQERTAATLDYFDVALEYGRHAVVLPALSTLASASPLDERLAGQMMLALYRNGRLADALDHYQQSRLLLADELGTDPGTSLQQLHHQILNADPALAEPTRTTALGRPPAPQQLVVALASAPHQLPVHTTHFVGRKKELDQLTPLLNPAVRGIGTPAVFAITGTAGVGKTALAVHWARRAAAWFPDGELYVDLHGFDPGGTPTRPAEAIRGFLDAFEIPPDRIPASLDAQVALYRSLLMERQMLVLLDNARDAEQVRPLLPSGHRCLVLVTSRDRLASLVAQEGARPIALDVLDPSDASALVGRFLGSDRTAAEPDAVRELIAHCARLPLALAMVAARAVTTPGFPLHVLAAELADEQHRLDALDPGEPGIGVRAVVSWSYRTLSQQAARLFRLLGLHSGPDIGLLAAASLSGDSVSRTRALLTELTRAHLLDEYAPRRYRFHDLLRAYAAERADDEEPGHHRQAAVRRMLDHYLHTSLAAAAKLESCRDPGPVPASEPGAIRGEIADYQGALDWFTAEYPALIAAAGQAAREGLDHHAWLLAWSPATFLDRNGHWHEHVSIQTAALAAADRLGDVAAQSRMHRNLGRTYVRLGCHAEADAHYQRALGLCQAQGDLIGQAHTHHGLSWACERGGHLAEALCHAHCALDLYRVAGNRTGVVHALNSLSWNHILLGRYEQALTHCRQALDLHRELDDQGGKAAILHSIGFAHHHLGQHTQAITHYEQSLALWRELADHYNEATTLDHIGDTHDALNDHLAARDAWQQALTVFEALAHPESDQVRAKLPRCAPRAVATP